VELFGDLEISVIDWKREEEGWERERRKRGEETVLLRDGT
jgi:hypothetical protein